MVDYQKLIIDTFTGELEDRYRETYGHARPELATFIAWAGHLLIDIDMDRIDSSIEMTRFPTPEGSFYRDTRGYPGLLRAADFIGQLGDPDYLRKLPALFYEFQETGVSDKLGYRHPGDLRAGYARFFWKVVSPYIQEALGHLSVTLDGKQWIANLHSHVFAVEFEERGRQQGEQG